jgi:hypothetical protein
MKRKKPDTPELPPILMDEADMHQYVTFRILDSIGYPGAYRKFMIKRKEQGADWAVQMNLHVGRVQQALKELSLLEQAYDIYAHHVFGGSSPLISVCRAGHQKVKRPQEPGHHLAACD